MSEAIMTNEFTLDGFRSPVTVDLNEMITKEDLLQFRAFQTWRDTLQKNLERQHNDAQHAFHEDPFVLKKVKIQSVDCFPGTKVAFVKLKAEIRNKQNQELPGIAFLRGGSVAVLMILRPVDSTDERWVVMTEQPRVPAGSLSFVEIPAGMLDDEGNFAGKAAKEIMEETGFKLPEGELIDLTELALAPGPAPEGMAPKGESIQEKECLQNAMYPSPGGSDEFIPIFLWEKVLLALDVFPT
ncbi:hypothetical protein ACET3X_003877 [Alternaria dauci]|uniref:Nudix hydrolase domain-containing protein n=1 Tax=Alternaria dauci TaxID=48095 RepID=A0ABR3UP26_9PLEO